MTKVEFCTRLCTNPYAEMEITLNDGKTIRGVIDEVRDDYAVIDETCAFGDMRIVKYGDINTVDMAPQYER